jgi:predicted nucleic acid-binding protein
VADVYLDSCCFIYLVEGQPPWRAAVETRLRGLQATTNILTSQLARLECRTKPMRDGDTSLLGRYDSLFAASRLIVAELSPAIIDRATTVRARYGFKSPDAIHLATAIEKGAVEFWTGDASLARCVEVRVVVLTASGP